MLAFPKSFCTERMSPKFPSLRPALQNLVEPEPQTQTL